jgi:DNA repair protein RadC
MEAAEFMKHTEEVADDFASRKIRELQKLNLIGDYKPIQMYRNLPIQQILMMIKKYRDDMRMNTIDSPEKVSEYFYNIVKSEL